MVILDRLRQERHPASSLSLRRGSFSNHDSPMKVGTTVPGPINPACGAPGAAGRHGDTGTRPRPDYSYCRVGWGR